MGEFKLVFRSEIILAACINDHIPVITEGKRYTPGPGLGKDADFPLKIQINSTNKKDNTL